jgi:hypothetical protein
MQTHYDTSIHAAHAVPRIMENGFSRRIIQRSLTELDDTVRGLRAMEHELSAFLTDYYHQILPLAEKIEILKCRIQKKPVIKTGSQVQVMQKESDPIEQKMKLLYRTLIKHYHPDIGQEKSSDTIIRIVAAYEAKSIGTLWQMNIDRVCKRMHHTHDVSPYLDTEKDEIFEILHWARGKRVDISTGASWLLKERVFDASLLGIDLIEKITLQLEEQARALHHHLRHMIANEKAQLQRKIQAV